MSRNRFDIKPDQLLARNIRALLSARREDDNALAMWCGHRPAWLSKILSGERGIRVKDLGRIADFFGIQVAELFQYGIDPLLERRKGERRTAIDRRTELDRRQPVRETDRVRKAPDDDFAPRPLPDPAIAVATRLTSLAEQLEAVAAAYLGRYPTTVSDVPAGSPESDPTLRSPSRHPRTRKAG